MFAREMLSKVCTRKLDRVAKTRQEKCELLLFFSLPHHQRYPQKSTARGVWGEARVYGFLWISFPRPCLVRASHLRFAPLILTAFISGSLSLTIAPNLAPRLHCRLQSPRPLLTERSCSVKRVTLSGSFARVRYRARTIRRLLPVVRQV